MSIAMPATTAAATRACLRWAWLAAALLLLACSRDPAPPAAAPGGPVAAVEDLLALVRAGDAAGYARAAVPPALQPQLEAAWRDGRGRWPVTGMPFGSRLPALLATLSADGSERRLQATFDRQFAGADRELRAAAMSLSLFGAEYVRNQPRLGEDERTHYTQLVQALGNWGREAPLADRARAGAAISRLAASARASGLASETDLRAAGMDDSLRRLGPFFAAWLETFAAYGLDLDAALAEARVDLVESSGQRARVRLRYTLAGHAVDTGIELRRIDGRWYPVDSLRHVQQALAQPADAGAAPAPVDAPAAPAAR